MADQPPRETEQSTTPGKAPSVTPPTYGETVGIMQIVEMTMQTQSTIGELRADVRNLTSRLDEDRTSVQTRLGRVEKFMWVTTAVVIVFIAVIGFVGWLLRPIVNAVVEKMI